MKQDQNNNKIALPRLDDFLLNLQTNNLSNETVYNYERDLTVLNNFLDEIKTPFAETNKKTILNYKAYLSSVDRQTAKNNLSKKKLSSFSINRMLSSFRSYLKFLNEMDEPTPLTADMIKLVKTERKTGRVSEFKQIVELIESPLLFEKNKKVALRNRAILEMLFSTGMRISELTNLKQSQIDKEGRIFIMGKGKKERFVYLTPRAVEHLKNYLGIKDSNHSPSPYLFVPFKGRAVGNKYKKLSNNYLQERIKKYRELLGINIPLSAHGIRHGFATYLAESGASPVAIQILLGHESLETTTRYVHASNKFAEKAHRQFHPLKK